MYHRKQQQPGDLCARGLFSFPGTFRVLEYLPGLGQIHVPDLVKYLSTCGHLAETSTTLPHSTFPASSFVLLVTLSVFDIVSSSAKVNLMLKMSTIRHRAVLLQTRSWQRVLLWFRLVWNERNVGVLGRSDRLDKLLYMNRCAPNMFVQGPYQRSLATNHGSEDRLCVMAHPYCCRPCAVRADFYRQTKCSLSTHEPSWLGLCAKPESFLCSASNNFIYCIETNRPHELTQVF